MPLMSSADESVFFSIHFGHGHTYLIHVTGTLFLLRLQIPHINQRMQLGYFYSPIIYIYIYLLSIESNDYRIYYKRHEC